MREGRTLKYISGFFLLNHYKISRQGVVAGGGLTYPALSVRMFSNPKIFDRSISFVSGRDLFKDIFELVISSERIKFQCLI